ncbi:MAG: hypothetical protein ACK5K7_05525 [Bacilli bacterium]
MKKKLISLLLISTLVFVGCGDSESTDSNDQKVDLSNGTYYATADVESNGWMNFLEFTVEDGKITDVTYDAYNMQDGDVRTKSERSEDGDYELSGDGAALYEQYEAIEDYIAEGNDVSEIEFDENGNSDAISTATIKYGNVQDLYENAVENGPIGDKGDLEDGYYFGQAEADSKGNTAQISYIVYNGVIVAAFADAAVPQDDGEIAYKSSLSIEGNYNLTEGSDPMHEQLAAISAYVVENQGFNDAEYDDEGKTDAISGATVTANVYEEAFDNAELVE